MFNPTGSCPESRFNDSAAGTLIPDTLVVNAAAALLKPKLRSSKHSHTGMTRGCEVEGEYDVGGFRYMGALDFVAGSWRI
jgi:hypothetical protein